ncbi:hypothetical protein L6259_01770 [Candidatus Parcubacteria bacterium]|nr:hypothetical protein [Patescibacteria group bacterium]MCG2693983.1 hypothetical protein [Candidatus Parcubacteria bacterium]
MKQLLLAIFSIIIFVSNASSETYRTPKIESIRSRIAGGTFDEYLALRALSGKKWELTALRIEIMGSAGAALRAYDIVNNMIDFKDTLNADHLNQNYANLPTHYETLQSLLSDSNIYLNLKTQGALAEYAYHSRIGSFFVSPYWEGNADVRIYSIDTDNIKLVADGENSYIDIGDERDIVTGLARADTGLYLGYARVFTLKNKSQISVAIKARVFHRLLVPLHKIHFNRQIRGNESDFSYPEDFSYVQGNGFAVDWSGAFALRDKFLDTIAHISMQNGPGKVWYEENGMFERPKVALGASIKPFHFIGHDKLEIATELECLEGPAIQLGIRYKLGQDNLHFMPGVGLIINEENVFSEKTNSVTIGFSSRLWKIISLDALYEYNISTGFYSLGVGMGFVLL